jgi:hypothetical protein
MNNEQLTMNNKAESIKLNSVGQRPAKKIKPQFLIKNN